MHTKELLYIRAVNLICFLFGVLGVILALIAESSSMLFDGMYSFIQSIFILLSSFVVKLISRKDDEYFHFGYSAFEPFYITLRTLSLISMNLILAFNALRNIIRGGYYVDAGIVLFFTGFSALICSGVYVFLSQKSKLLHSPMLRTEAKSWLNDTLISVAVLVSFSAMALLEKTGIGRANAYIDPVITLIFALILTPGLIKELWQALKDLLDAAPPREIQERLENIVGEFDRKYAFKDWKIFSSKHGRFVSSTIYILLSKDITIHHADILRKAMMKAIRASWPWSDTDIVFSIDSSWMEYAVPATDEENEITG